MVSLIDIGRVHAKLKNIIGIVFGMFVVLYLLGHNLIVDVSLSEQFGVGLQEWKWS